MKQPKRIRSSRFNSYYVNSIILINHHLIKIIILFQSKK